MLSAKKELFTPSGGGYQISRSVRLRSSASAYLSRTFGTPTSNTTWTYSVWVKRSRTGANETLLTRASDVATMYFESGTDQLVFWTNTQTESYYRTSRRFRDPSAWMHIVWIYNTTNATQADRSQLWINGVRETAFATSSPQPSLNATSGGMNASVGHTIGGPSNLLDGYLTEINFIDGQALTPDNFGEIDTITGVWKPKKYAGTYGSNGFYLNFSDNSGVTATTIGKDYSGNGNNWTPSVGISITAGATYDSMIDVPTLYADGGNGRGNYCVLNPLDGNNATLSGANLNFVTLSTGAANTLGSIYVSTGKWYWEQVATSNGQYVFCGIRNGPSGYYVNYYGDNGNKNINGTASAYGATFGNNDVMGVALDMDAGTITFYKNNASQGAITIGNSGPFAAWIADGASGISVTGSINFGQRPFSYTPPTGFKALNTQNLPDATIKKGGLYMKSVLYAGTSPTIKSVTGVGFQPDFTWIKGRVTGYGHALFDAVRGATKRLQTNTTTGEATSATYLTSFDSDGFTVDTDYGQNAPAEPYVSWNWNAGGSTVTNTEGTITSQVRANPTAGFSVVTYTGTGANATVGHGLNVTPKFIIIKGRNTAYNWAAWHGSFTGLQRIFPNTTGGVASSATYWNSATPTPTTFSLGSEATANDSTRTFVAYCWSEVAGYSKFGSYTGNSAADGTFVYLGFRPQYILIKGIGSTGSGWIIYDSSRDTYNVATKDLRTDLSNAEPVSSGPIDFLSNGFKLRGTDTNSNSSSTSYGPYIYAAFAENPFKNSLAR